MTLFEQKICMVSDQCHWPIAFMFMRRQYFKIRQCQLLFTTFVIISTMHVLLQKCSINLPLTLHSSNAAVSQSLWVIVQLATAARSVHRSQTSRRQRSQTLRQPENPYCCTFDCKGHSLASPLNPNCSLLFSNTKETCL